MFIHGHFFLFSNNNEKNYNCRKTKCVDQYYFFSKIINFKMPNYKDNSILSMAFPETSVKKHRVILIPQLHLMKQGRRGAPTTSLHIPEVAPLLGFESNWELRQIDATLLYGNVAPLLLHMPFELSLHSNKI